MCVAVTTLSTQEGVYQKSLELTNTNITCSFNKVARLFRLEAKVRSPGPSAGSIMSRARFQNGPSSSHLPYGMREKCRDGSLKVKKEKNNRKDTKN